MLVDVVGVMPVTVFSGRGLVPEERRTNVMQVIAPAQSTEDWQLADNWDAHSMDLWSINA